MRRLIVMVIAVLGVVGVVITTHSSSAAGPRGSHGGVARVVVTPRLKRLLQAEMSTLRAGQPRAPRRGRFLAPARGRSLAPAQGVTCFVAGTARCPEIPCQEFASAPAVLKTSTEIIGPGGGRKVGARAQPACTRRPPRKLVLVSGP